MGAFGRKIAGRKTVSIAPLKAGAALLLCAALSACATAYGGISTIMPGMNQTELQGVMGPPDYIQIKGKRQAWQYCPHMFDRREEGLYTTIFFYEGRVEHMRGYPDAVMGSCNDYIAAFRWEDQIEGEFLQPGMSSGPAK